MVSFSQVFLKDKQFIEKILESLDVKEGDTFLEVGPGEGVITKELLRKNAKVYAVEIDMLLCRKLEKEFDILLGKRFFLFNEDFLKFNMQKLPERIRFFSNLPYAITKQAMNKLIRHKDRFLDIHLMLQKEFVEKVERKDSFMSMLIHFHFEFQKLFNVPRTAFKPMPKVHSTFVRMKPIRRVEIEGFEKLFERIIKRAYMNRRRKLKNALKPYKVPSVYENARAEELSLEDFMEITKENLI